MIPLVEGVSISEGAAMGASFTETTSWGDSGTLKILIHCTSEWWRVMSNFSHNFNYGNAPDWFLGDSMNIWLSGTIFSVTSGTINIGNFISWNGRYLKN